MNIEMVDGEVVLIGIDGSPIVEPQPGRLQCITHDDGHWEMRFATSHQFHLLALTTCWLRFTDSDGRIRLQQPQGSPQVVTVLPTAHL
jgi:hypothetical protein